MRLIGDIHGDFGTYKNIVKDCKKSIQVGDFGVGFNEDWDGEVKTWQQNNSNHYFIRGNHDDLASCVLMPNYIKDGTKDIWPKTMLIGGAWSIDYAYRRENVSWWSDEECSSEQFDGFTKIYNKLKPRIMITHEAPLQVPSWNGFVKGDLQITRTGLRLAHMWVNHKPSLWVFGHWHQSFDKVIEDTRFICLNINEYIDVDLDTLEVK